MLAGSWFLRSLEMMSELWKTVRLSSPCPSLVRVQVASRIERPARLIKRYCFSPPSHLISSHIDPRSKRGAENPWQSVLDPSIYPQLAMPGQKCQSAAPNNLWTNTVFADIAAFALDEKLFLNSTKVNKATRAEKLANLFKQVACGLLMEPEQFHTNFFVAASFNTNKRRRRRNERQTNKMKLL